MSVCLTVGMSILFIYLPGPNLGGSSLGRGDLT